MIWFSSLNGENNGLSVLKKVYDKLNSGIIFSEVINEIKLLTPLPNLLVISLSSINLCISDDKFVFDDVVCPLISRKFSV